MSWDSVDNTKASEKQIKYAETLLEAYYGDINFPIYTMNSRDISALIDDVKKKCQEKNINYHSSTTEQVTGQTVEPRHRGAIRRNDSFGTIPYYPIFDEFHNDVHAPAVSQMIRSEEELEQIIAEIDRSVNVTTVNSPINQSVKVNFSWRGCRKVICIEIQQNLNATLEIVSRQREIFVRETAVQEQQRRQRDREINIRYRTDVPIAFPSAMINHITTT